MRDRHWMHWTVLGPATLFGATFYAAVIYLLARLRELLR